MKRLPILLLTNLLCLIVYPVFSQGYLPSSADAMGLARLASTGVGHYTGTLGVNVPITELKGRELSVPIGLSYNAQGIKLNEISSSVGLGWNLSAGGVITRVVRGEPDDLTNGFCTSNFSDKEPDIFYFNFLGQSGKFILERYGNPITIPFRPIAIKPGICKPGADGTWEIVDENGLIFTFGTLSSSQARESTTTTPWVGSSKTYVSSWYLSKVQTPNKTEEIRFNYTSGSYTTISHYFRLKEDNCNNKVEENLSTSLYIQTRYVSLIEAFTYVNSNMVSIGKINFSYSNAIRKDVPGALMLSSLELKNKADERIAKYRFEYSYFQAAGCSTEDCFRLRLDKIYDLAPDPLHTFSYNTTVNLPSRYSKNFDHWGFYNNNTVDKWLPSPFNWNNYTFYDPYYGASRDPHVANSQANILTGMAVRGGSSRTFVYEGHTNGWGYVVSGGARIKTETVSDGNGNSYTRSFNYGVPTANSFLFYWSDYSLTHDSGSSTIYEYIIFSHSYREVFDLEGVSVGYPSVEEAVSGQGKTVYTFTDITSHPDLISGNVRTDHSFKRGKPKTIEVYSQAGALLSKQIIDYDFDQTDRAYIQWQRYIEWKWGSCPGYSQRDRSTSYYIKFVSRPVRVTKQTNEVYDQTTPSRKQVTVNEFTYDYNTNQVIDVIAYDDAQPAKKYIQRSKYVVHNDFYEASSNDCNDQYASCNANCASEPDSQVQSFCYTSCLNSYNICTIDPSNFDTASKAIVLLNNRHQINTPVEVLSLFQEGSTTTVLASNLYSYETSGTWIRPKVVYGMKGSIDQGSFVKSKILSNGTFEKDGSLRQLNSFDLYDASTGNLTRETSAAGVQKDYTWDNGQTAAQITSTTTSSGGLSRTNSFTYKQMAGITSTTDVNSRTSSQLYDDYNRPSITKDTDGNIIGRTRYHYANETPGFRITTSVGRYRGLVNESFQFNIVDVATSIGGTPTFVWDLAGTVVDNSATATKSFGTTGDHLVKVVAMNPEYGPVVRTVTMNINPALSFSICVNGYTSANACTSVTYGDIPGGCTDAGHNSESSPVELSVPNPGGCGPEYKYVWEQRPQGGSWSTYATTATVTFSAPSNSNTEFRCTITDECNNQSQATITIARFNSCP